MARSLNSVQLIGNLTRDPELRYTPTGVAVCTLGLATNRVWNTDKGEKKEEVEYHRVIAWNKLAELCSQLLSKGSKVYVHGRLATRSWTSQDNQQKSVTEIVMDDMIILSSKKEGSTGAYDGEANKTVSTPSEVAPEDMPDFSGDTSVDVSPDDIPF